MQSKIFKFSSKLKVWDENTCRCWLIKITAPVANLGWFQEVHPVFLYFYQIYIYEMTKSFDLYEHTELYEHVWYGMIST